MSSQGSQTWLRSPMSIQGSQTWLRLSMPERGDPYFWYTKEVVRNHQSKQDRQLITKLQTTININSHLNQHFQ
jgi:hypothetical protein